MRRNGDATRLERYLLREFIPWDSSTNVPTETPLESRQMSL